MLLARIVFANAVMAALLRLDGAATSPSWLAASPLQRAARLAVCIVAAAALYFAALFVAGVRLAHMRSGRA